MKKYILSAVVILSFLFYSFVTRKDSVSSPVSNPAPTLNPDSGNNITTIPNPTTSTGYNNGTYNGDVADAYYGNIQVAAVIQNGKLADITILQYPNDRNRSIAINTYALPVLQSEAIQIQNASVDIVSGATDTSRAFVNSLQSALDKAKK